MRTDTNGQVIEELLDEKNLVCLNDGSKTRIDVHTGKESGMVEWCYPVMVEGNETAVTNREKAELMAKTFVTVHSSNNLQEESRRGREKTKLENMEALGKKMSMEDGQNVPFRLG